ncbi:MAG TPA: NAD(P)H-dependent oxidoreductase [Candidatus Ozemobacteraceae bacterium]|nr:NAD(P)H-dependent oxidoreductase [Candidatus Ozemobacteraceae bacterium]
MNRLLHIIASPRGEASRTLALSRVFLEKYARSCPHGIVDELDLYREALPELAGEGVGGKYLLMAGRSIPPEMKPVWKSIESHVNRFVAADGILLSVPMWNFGIPYKLKHYFDVICQPRYLFRYTDIGPVGMCRGKKAFLLSTRGNDYSESSPLKSADFVTPYLKHLLGFIGIADVTVITAEPMDTGEEGQRQKLQAAIKRIEELPL